MQGACVALQELREQGVVWAISVGCWDAALLTRFAEAGDFDAFLLPGKYTFLDESALDELLLVCVRKNISVIVGTSYGKSSALISASLTRRRNQPSMTRREGRGGLSRR